MKVDVDKKKVDDYAEPFVKDEMKIQDIQMLGSVILREKWSRFKAKFRRNKK